MWSAAEQGHPGVTVTPGPAVGYEMIAVRVTRAPDTSKFARLRVTVAP